MKTNNLNDLSKYLKNIEKNAKELEKTTSVSFDVLFNSNFMQKYTNFLTFDELLNAGKYVVNSQEDFEAIPEKEFDKYISTCTKFDNWQDMLNTASSEYAIKKLGL